MSLSRTLKNRQEDPHALTVTIPDYSLSYANKSQANEVATRICCQGILYHSMYAKHSWGWKQIFGEAFEQYLSIQKKYCERKSWKLFQESRKRWQNSAKANSCCPVKYGKLSRILFSAIMECTWHYWKQEKKSGDHCSVVRTTSHLHSHCWTVGNRVLPSFAPLTDRDSCRRQYDILVYQGFSWQLNIIM